MTEAQAVGEMLGAMIAGAALVLGPVVLLGIKLLRAVTTQSKSVGEHVIKGLLGKDDPTPREIGEDDTGAINLAMRQELRPVNKQLREHGRMLRQLVTETQDLHARDHELSGRLAQVEGCKEPK